MLVLELNPLEINNKNQKKRVREDLEVVMKKMF